MMTVEIQLICICRHGLKHINHRHAKAGEFLCRWEILLHSCYVVFIVSCAVGAVMRTWYYSEFDWIVRIVLMFSAYLVVLLLCFIVENVFLINKLKKCQNICAVSNRAFDEYDKPFDEPLERINGRTENIDGSKVPNYDAPISNAYIEQLAKYRL